MGNIIQRIFGQQKQKRVPIPKKIRNNVWIYYHGNKDTGKCYCCGIVILKNKGWHCSHVVSYDKGGPNILENLRTCCRHCNLSMGNCNLYIYIKEKKLKGPGHVNSDKYLKNNKSQRNDKRTNNWGKS